MKQILSKKQLWLLIPIFVAAASTALAEGAKGGQLYFTDVTDFGGLIGRLNIDNKKLKLLVPTGDGVRGIAVDSVNAKIYWSDVNRHAISKANLDGRRRRDIVTTGLDFPFDVDIDVRGRKIYWSDPSQNKIGRANLDGTDQTFIIPFPCVSSVGNFCAVGGGLAIDSVNKKLYWTTAYCSDDACSTPESYLGDIFRADLDGSNIESVVAAVGRPASIQVDPIGNKIYWTDSVNDVVRRSNLDGTEINDLFVVGDNNNPNGLALDLNNNYIYWDQDSGVQDRSCIKRMRLNGRRPENVRCGFGNAADIEFVGVPAQH